VGSFNTVGRARRPVRDGDSEFRRSGIAGEAITVFGDGTSRFLPARHDRRARPDFALMNEPKAIGQVGDQILGHHDKEVKITRSQNAWRAAVV